MIEPIEGNGTLRRHSPPAQWSVSYRLQVSTQIVTKRGFPRAARRFDISGTVDALNGDVIPLGEYELRTSDGELLKVDNSGGTWTVLATQ